MISPSILLPHSAMYSKYPAAAPISPKAKDLILPCSSTTILAMSSALSRILFAIFFWEMATIPHQKPDRCVSRRA